MLEYFVDSFYLQRTEWAGRQTDDVELSAMVIGTLITSTIIIIILSNLYYTAVVDDYSFMMETWYQPLSMQTKCSAVLFGNSKKNIVLQSLEESHNHSVNQFFV